MMQDLANVLRAMDADFGGPFFVVVFLLLLLGLGVLVFFLITLHKTLESVAPDNRKMMPGLVWLMLIPYFHFIWLFIMPGKIADSLAAEFKRRNVVIFEERPGFGTGMAWAFVGLISVLLGFVGTNMLSVILNFVWLLCGITYWVKIAGFHAKLKESGHWTQYAPPPVYAPYPPQPYAYVPPVYPPVNPYSPPPQQSWMYPPPVQPPYYPPPQYPPYDPAMPPPPNPFPAPYDPNDLSRWAPPADPTKEKE